MQAFDPNTLTSELEKLFSELIEPGITREVQLILTFKEKIIKRFLDYEADSQKAIEKNSVRALLYENVSLSNSVFELLEETIKEKPSGDLIDNIDQFLHQAFRAMEIIPENRIVAAAIEKAFPGYFKKKGLLEIVKTKVSALFGKYFPASSKTPATENDLASSGLYPNRNFFFKFLVVKNLNDQVEIYQNFLSDAVKLLHYFWTHDNKRTEVFSQIDHDSFDDKTVLDPLKLTNETEEIKSLVKDFNSLKEQLIDNRKNYFDNFFMSFNDGKVFATEKFSANTNIEKECKRLLSDIETIRNNWNNTAFLLTEDWKLDLEIYSFRFNIIKEYFEFSHVMNNKFTIPVNDVIQQIRESLIGLKSKLDPSESNVELNFQDEYSKAKIEFKRKLLLKLIPLLKEVLLKSDIPHEIDSIENISIKNFNTISKKRYLLKNPDYSRPIQRSEFDTISPYELMAYEVMPGLKSVFPELKSNFIRHVQHFEEKLSEIPDIIEFAIESAIVYFQNNENNVSEAIKIGSDGVKRAENKLNDLNQLHSSFINQEIKKLKNSIDDFIQEITVIADNESAYQIKIRITKLKAIEKSKIIKSNISKQIRNTLPVIIDFIRESIAFLRRSSEKISKKFIYEEYGHYITTDISDYLTDTEKTIGKLPFVYQRLFKIEALTSFELFIDRPQQMELLVRAYNKWKDGNFAPAVVVGEKGSGKTTLINRFLKSKIQKEKVTIIDLQKMNANPEIVFEEIGKVVSALTVNENTVDPSKGNILIIDGLERLFVSEINGFRYLIKTMKLISETNSGIFWIVCCHLYSWRYLEKLYSVSDYFGYHIKLNELSAFDIEQIIFRRHNISGFKLRFESVSTAKSVLNFKKFTDEEKQLLLKQEYFKDLTEFNKSNIAQAFLYWLRSTSRLENDIIYVRKISEMSNSFIYSVSHDKMVILRNILIHNGITAEGHARIFRIDAEMSKLYLDQMLDDGLLIKDDYYYINPMIYSQIVNEIFKLNLLH